MASIQCADNFHAPLSTPQSLCQRCSGIKFEGMIPSRKKTRPRTVRLGPAADIVSDITCSMCQVFGQTFQQRKYLVAGQDYSLYPFYTSHIHAYKWIYGSQREGISETVSFAIVDELDMLTLRQHVWSMRDTIKECGWISPLPVSTKSCSFIPRQLGSKVDFEVIRGWLNFCTSNHRNTCCRLPDRVMIPIKLIDCATRTITTAVSGSCYVAISYVWGCPSMAGVDDYGSADENRLIGPLPNVIEDAIIATEKLGFRYLWIDRYCIDQQDAEQKAAQIQQMDLIYSLAECTIVAAAGHDPTAGLPGVSTKVRTPRSSATTRGGTYISVPPEPLLTIQNSAWNSRGWTFQEAVLSRRCIIFCVDQVYFTCGAMTCRDAMDTPLAALHRKNLQRFSAWNDNWNESYNDTAKDNRLFGTIDRVRYPLHEFSKLVQAYTARSMSDPDDILDGIRGIIQKFKSVHQTFRQFHGVIVVPDTTFLEAGNASLPPEKRKTRSSSYTEQLATGLCWDFDHNLYQSGERRDGFPSWSWTGWIDQITCPSEYDGYISNTHDLQVRVEDMHGNIIDWEEHCKQNPTDDGLANVKTHLRIEGSFVNVSLHHSATDPCHANKTNQGQGAVWWAVIEREDRTMLSARLGLNTPEAEMGQFSYNKLKTGRWPGLILGTRCGTYYAGTLQRVHNPQQTDLVLMVVHRGSALVERVGLAVFKSNNQPETMPTSRRSITLV